MPRAFHPRTREGKLRIAIIGAGNVGKALGVGWLRAGHQIVFGVRRPQDSKYRELAEAGATIETVAEAVRDTEVVVLATPWGATEAAIRTAGGLAGKVVVDCTNPLKPDLSGLTHGDRDSGGEQVARWAPDAKVVSIAGKGVGTVRRVDTPAGPFVERCEAHDEEGKSFSYALLESPFPFESYLAVVKLTPLGGERCAIDWSCDFQTAPEAVQALQKGVEDVYRHGFIASIRKTLGTHAIGGANP